MKQKKLGFSFIELILMLVFFFLVMASLMPMITRRHIAPPTRASHGTYACYWEPQAEGEPLLKETLIKGKKTIIDNQTVDEAVGCRFEAPRKAKYFYVQMIGGGGGGQDLTWEDIDPEFVPKYRVYGRREISADDEGYFVQDAYPYVDSSHILKGFDFGLLDNDYWKYKDLVTGHSIILHGTSEDGHACVTCSDSELAQDGGTGRCCEQGQVRENPFCQAKKTKEEACTTLSGQENVTDFKKIDDGYGEIKYRYSCPDEDGDNICDPGSCQDVILCDEVPLEFSADIGQSTGTCTNGTAPDKGVQAYTKVNLDGLFSGNFLSYLVSGSVVYTRHKGNHKACDEGGRWTSSYYNYNQSMDSAVYNKYNAVDDVIYFNKKSANMTPPRYRLPDGEGVYFDGKLSSTMTPLYICGGQGAERGLKMVNNPRKAKSNDYCTPSDAYGGYVGLGDQYGVHADGLLLGPAVMFISSLITDTGGAKSGYPTTTSSKVHNFLTTRIIEAKLYQEQEIPYGVGGRAGELKTMILKTVPNNVYMMPGKGGNIGEDGDPTIFGSNAEGSEISEKVANGGRAGTSIYAVDANIGAFKADGSTKQNNKNHDSKNRVSSTEDQDSRFGGTISYSTFVKFVISYQNRELKERMSKFGSGGNGAYTKTEATCGYDYNAVVFYDSEKDPAIINFTARSGKPVVNPGYFTYGGNNCNSYPWVKVQKPDDVKDKEFDEDPAIHTNGYYWGYYKGAFSIPEEGGHAQPGQTGAIVISW